MRNPLPESLCHCTTSVTIACAVMILEGLNLPVPSHLQFLMKSSSEAARATAVEILSSDDDDKRSAVNSVAGLHSVKSVSSVSNVSSTSLSAGAARAALNRIRSGPSGLKRRPSTQSLPETHVQRGYRDNKIADS